MCALGGGGGGGGGCALGVGVCSRGRVCVL